MELVCLGTVEFAPYRTDGIHGLQQVKQSYGVSIVGSVGALDL
jgi:hypothetical protein